MSKIYPKRNKMSFLALLLWAVMSGGTVVEYGKQPLDMGLVEQVSTQHIYHSWFSSDDQRQLVIQKAYDLGWIDFVLMLECENGNWDINAVGDRGHAFGLCQLNNRWHEVTYEYKNSWEVQIETCYQKWSTWTKFYWPTRKVHGQICKDYVRNRFIING